MKTSILKKREKLEIEPVQENPDYYFYLGLVR